MKREIRNSLILILFFAGSSVFGQISRTIDSLMTIPLIQGVYGFDLPGGDLSSRFGFNHEIGLGFHIKTKKGWIYGTEATFIFGDQVTAAEEANIDPLRDENNNIIGSNNQGAYFTDYNLLQRGRKLPVFKFGKVFHNDWLRGSKNSGLFVRVGVGYWRYRLKIHDIDRSIEQLKGDYVKGYDHLTGGLMTTQSVRLSFDC